MKTKPDNNDIMALKDLYNLNPQAFDARALEQLKRKDPSTQANILKVTDVVLAFANAGHGPEIGNLIKNFPREEQDLIVTQIMLDTVRTHSDLPARLGIEHLARTMLSKTNLPGLALDYPT